MENVRSLFNCLIDCYEFLQTEKEKKESDQPLVEPTVIEMETLPKEEGGSRIKLYQQLIHLSSQLNRFSGSSLLQRSAFNNYHELHQYREQILAQLGIDYRISEATKELWIHLKKIHLSEPKVIEEFQDEFKEEILAHTDKGADLNLCHEKSGDLMLSQVAHAPELVRFLYNLGASFELKDAKNKNLLNFLLDREKGSMELVLYALENGADPEVSFSGIAGRPATLLHRIALFPPQGELFTEILSYSRPLLDRKDEYEETPLDKIFLSRSDQFPFLENAYDLIQEGAEVHEETILHFREMILADFKTSWTEKELEVVKYFMDKEEMRGFLHEITTEHEDIEELVRIFAVAGISLNRLYHDETPLSTALKNQRVKNAEALVKYGAIVDHDAFEHFLELEKVQPSCLYHPEIGRELAAQILFTGYHRQEGWNDIAFTSAFGIHQRLKSILVSSEKELSEPIEALGKKTPLDLAIERNQLYSAYLLYSKGADFTVRPKEEMHALVSHMHKKRDLRHLVHSDSLKEYGAKAKDRSLSPYKQRTYAHIQREYEMIRSSL